MPGRHIEFVSIQTLIPNARNPRTHSQKQIKQIAKSIRQFGFTAPLIIDSENKILAGHGRLEAAKLTGLAELPCIRLGQLSEVQKRALTVADNQLAANANWDVGLLAEELQFILSVDFNFDVDTIGFGPAEADSLIAGLGEDDPGDPRDDALPARDAGPPVTRLGDVWKLGDHRLICGDARDPMVVEKLMAGEQAQMVFTDPPFNLKIAGHVSGLGKTKHREFVMTSGEMTPAEFTAFLAIAFQNLASHCIDGGIIFVCTD
jgi:hypothetical protein